MIHTQEQQQPDSGAVRSLSIFCLEKVCYLPWKGEQAQQQQQQHKQRNSFFFFTVRPHQLHCQLAKAHRCDDVESTVMSQLRVSYVMQQCSTMEPVFFLPSITQVETGSNVACALYLPFLLLFIISLQIQRRLNFFQSWRNEPSDNQLSRCDRLLYLFPSKARQCIFTKKKKELGSCYNLGKKKKKKKIKLLAIIRTQKFD
jgi:hypothetical protein